MSKSGFGWQPYLWMACGAVWLTLADFCMKQVAMQGVHPATGFAMATPLSVILIVVLAQANGGVRRHLMPKHPQVLLLRGAFMIGMSFLNFIGLMYNPYSQQVMILQLGPIIAALLAVLLLKEGFSKHQLLVAVICLVSVWFIIDPRFGSGTVYLLIALGAAFFNAAANVFIAYHRDKHTPIGFTFYGMLITVTLSGIIHLGLDLPLPGWSAFWWLQAMGGLAVLGLASVSRGLQLAADGGRAGSVGLMFYVQMPVALAIGYWVYGEQSSTIGLLGACMIVLAGMSLPLRAALSLSNQVAAIEERNQPRP